jgi:hypothetical protein
LANFSFRQSKKSEKNPKKNPKKVRKNSVNSGNSGNSGPDLFTSGLFLRLKLGLPGGLAGADGPVRPQAGLTQSGNPNFNLKKKSW